MIHWGCSHSFIQLFLHDRKFLKNGYAANFPQEFKELGESREEVVNRFFIC